MQTLVSTLQIIYTSISSLEEGLKLARKIIEEKLAGCVNVIPQVYSVFQWEGAMNEEQEAVLICKTTKENAGALMEWIESHHPYNTPAILQWEVQSSTSFHEWIAGAL